MELGTGVGMQSGIIHAEGVHCWEWRGEALSSTPQACGLVPIIRAEGAHACGRLPGWRDAFELMAEMLEVIRADAQLQHFFDDR
jgi:hypothetical protein